MIEYRFATPLDMVQIANIHKEQFPTHYLGQFSVSLLVSFYQTLLCDGHIFIVAVEGEVVLGFVLGGEWKRITESLKRFMKKFILRSIFESVIRPKTWQKSVQKILSFFFHRKKDPNNLDNIERYTLLSVATNKAAQGMGIGTGLVNAFNKEIEKFSCKYYLSVKDTNIRAIRFYSKLGFVEAYRCPGEIQMIKTL